MKTLLLKIIFLALFLASPAYAENGNGAAVTIKNPARTIGIHIGDALTRNIVIETAAGQKIVATSLPIKGARTEGIELVDVKLSSDESEAKATHTLALRYQVFADAVSPVVMKLPAESLQLSDGQKVEIPTWNFWFSPLVNTPLVNVLPNVQPMDKTPLIDQSRHESALVIYLSLLVIGLIGAIYVNADRQWLPFMGGAFSRAYRSIRKVARSREDDNAKVKKALVNLHQAFNETYGRNLFLPDVDDFIKQHPGYQKIATDISRFFEKSNQALFSRRENNLSELVANLLAFSKSLRDCERGI